MAATAAVLLITTDGTAEACRCSGPKTPTKGAVKRADAVFIGKIKAIRFDEGIPPRVTASKWHRPIPTTLVFDVLRVHKGQVHTRTEVSLGRTSCTINNSHRGKIRVGDEWAIVAKRDNKGRLFTRQCMGSQLTKRAHAALGRLGSGLPPLPPKAAKP